MHQREISMRNTRGALALVAAMFCGVSRLTSQSVTVDVGKVANVSLKLKPLAVKTEVTVTAIPGEVKERFQPKPYLGTP
jgi:predicted anti-sigma-YlaC factor YlaD